MHFKAFLQIYFFEVRLNLSSLNLVHQILKKAVWNIDKYFNFKGL